MKKNALLKHAFKNQTFETGGFVKQGFTLAETLITLMIIGVIAVMTIPALKDHSDEAKYVAAVKKAYASVSAASQAIEAKHTDMAFWDCSTKTIEWFKEVVNTVPNTGASSWEHLTLAGTADGHGGGKITPSFISADGMSWEISGSKGQCMIVIDTNAQQPPNVTGIDQFMFRVGKSTNGVDYGVYPSGTTGHDSNTSWCTSKVILTGKMPWLRQIGKASKCDGY